MQPIIIYWAPNTPNPSKALIIFEELGLPYEGRFVPTDELEKAEYEAINPTGRLPALYDPNYELTLWESGAMMMYLVDTYDLEDKINIRTSPEKYLLQQWSLFQASDQGPYFGQAAWFNCFHFESLASAKERYGNEIKHVVGVLDRALRGNSWLVGEKCTYADLAFCTWNMNIDSSLQGGLTKFNIDEYPDFKRWQEWMMTRDSVQKVLSMAQSEEVSSKGRM